MRLALGLQYNGVAFCGWQTQPNRAAVQDVLEDALARFAGTALETVCAGRTDAGVHATHQVVHTDTHIDRPMQSWVRGVNRWLPAALAVRWAAAVPDDFHARFSARLRRYDYWLLNDAVRAPLLDGRVGWVFRSLDLATMSEAARALVGRHDFTSFRSSQCQAASPIRELGELKIEQFGRLIRFRFVANAFLHHMVRNLVGTLVSVGMGRHAPQWAADVLAARDRRLAAPTFSAAGLYLTGVDYDRHFLLPQAEEYSLIA